MLGPDVLVAPVLEEGAVERQVYLPVNDGGWYDWHDNRHFAGGEVATVAAPLGRLPLFVRSGAIVPIEAGDGIGLRVFAAANGAASGALYLDDGRTAAWREQGRQIDLSVRVETDGSRSVAVTDPSFKPVSIDWM